MSNNFTANLKEIYSSNKRRFVFLALTVLSIATCAISSSLHYDKTWEGNDLTWISWVVGMISMVLAFVPLGRPFFTKKEFYIKNKLPLIFFGFLTIIFFVTHLWNWDTAPWNQGGLFDDASWDIYFSEKYITDGPYFQAAFSDFGICAREVIFHYYIIPFFKIIGYNLLVFNISLLLLGYVTFIFMSMIIHRIFKNYTLTFICAVAFNFLPIHFIQIFAGHRYAISAPLMLTSLYFIYTGFSKKSFARIAFASVITGLCVACATMGKQYLEALIGAVVLFIIFNFKKTVTKRNWDNVKVLALGILIATTPLIIYAVYNREMYFAIEGSYMKQFIESITNDGMDGFMVFFNRMKDCLFGETYYKWFVPDYPLIPYSYYLLLIPGLFIAFFKKHYQLVLVAFLASFGALIAGYSDYRVLHSSPFWVILMAFTVNEMIVIAKWIYSKFKSKKEAEASPIPRIAALVPALIIISIGVVSCAGYLYKLSTNPFSVHHLNQRVVAVSRYVRDITAGVPEPSTELRWEEFKKLKGYPDPNYETLICLDAGYAIPHTFLYEYDDKKILSLSDDIPANLFKSPEEVLSANKKGIQNYVKTDKDLKLIWENTGNITAVIEKFRGLSSLGSIEEKTMEYKGQKVTFFILNIKNNNIDEFKQKVSEISM